MKKIILSVIAALLSVGAYAADYKARVDIVGIKDAIVLEKGAVSDGGSMSTAGWLKDKGQDTQYLYVEFPASSEWKTASFSFTPSKDGKLDLNLKGQYMKGADGAMVPTWIVYDDIAVDGVTLNNGNFEEDAKGWWIGGNDKDGKASIVGGKSGKGIKVWHNASATQQIDVKAGQPVKVMMIYKKAE